MDGLYIYILLEWVDLPPPYLKSKEKHKILSKKKKKEKHKIPQEM